MDRESWIAAAALVFCILAITTCEPSKKHCDVIHENAPTSLEKCEIW
jgi:hypothetical protein